ncbi:probable G-protein coupled receptor 33 [Elgaria multicarinata webbii]|uniref:probable G-protein coupled receptor 33 n=1 Tax=Elgaria multicarinata webbii TaxID=159646 RepID=UPI002FCD55A5
MMNHSGNTSVTYRNESHPSLAMNPTNVITAFLLLMSFLVGMTINGLFLWVLGVKMKRTVNTLWFLHLILTYLISCFLLPFFAVYILHDFCWTFKLTMCKIVLSSFSVVMFTTVFLLTIISLDRYLFTCHSIWSQHHRTIPRARRIIAGVWLASLALSVPNLFFLTTQEVKGKMKCNYRFIFSNDRGTVHLTFFSVRFLLAFLLPFVVIMGCYCRTGCKMKTKRLVRTGKPFRILVASVTSFFICWLPYHLYQAALLLDRAQTETEEILWDLTAAGGCFNICFTPILYLFVGEKFQQVFKTSMLTLLKKGFVDYPINPGDNINTTEEVDQTHGKSAQELKVTQGNHLP